MAKQPRRQKRIPQRMCVICRQKTDKRRLTRIVNTPEDGVLVDPTGKKNGRGAYVCDQPKCWQKIVSDTRILDQALKTKMNADDLTAIAAQSPVT